MCNEQAISSGGIFQVMLSNGLGAAVFGEIDLGIPLGKAVFQANDVTTTANMTIFIHHPDPVS
jgi:hypothetical protein